MKPLHLHVKTEYFEAIQRGEKTEEYRLQNDYWIKRLQFENYPHYDPREFSGLVIYNAYKPGDHNRMHLPWRGFTIKQITHPHFGNEPVSVFAIKLSGRANE